MIDFEQRNRKINECARHIVDLDSHCIEWGAIPAVSVTLVEQAIVKLLVELGAMPPSEPPYRDVAATPQHDAPGGSAPPLAAKACEVAPAPDGERRTI